MAVYTLNFSNPNKIEKIIVPDTVSGTGVNNYDTSLDLVGSGYPNYGNAIAQNFLKLLENFASPNPPSNAIEGQLWYDVSNQNKKVLKINNGSVTNTRWAPVSGLFQQSNDPSINFSSIVTDGDLWVDTSSNQLKLRYSGYWTTVGPSTTTGISKTGSETVSVESTTGNFYPVVLNWSNGSVVEIISFNEFTPKYIIDGFYTLKVGTNLTSKVVARYNGVAEKALALQTPAGLTINSTELLRNNALLQTFTGTFVVESGSGLIVKNSSVNKSIKLYNNVSGNFIDASESTSNLKIIAGPNSYLYLSSIFNNIGINTATTSASPTLDVVGSARFVGSLTVLAATTISNSIVTDGRLVVGNSLIVGANLLVDGNSTLRGAVTLGSALNSGTSILRPSLNDVFDLGTTSTAFRTLYVSEINNTNTFVRVYGRVIGTADTLTYPRYIGFYGQVTSTNVSFDGSSNAIFNVTATPSLITAQSNASLTTSSQTLLVYNTATSGNLEKINKNLFLSDIYPNIISTGMMFAYSTSTAPTGYLLCNGATYSQVTYNNLYSVIGGTYGSGVGTFNVPDLSTATNANGMPIFYIIRI